MEKVTRFEVSWKIFWQIFAFIFILAVLFIARQAFGVLLVAIVISLGLEPVISFLEQRRVNRLLGAIIVFLAGLLIFSAALYFIVPVLALEVGRFLNDINSVIADLIGIGLPQKVIQGFSLSFDKALGVFTAAQASITGAIGVVFNRVILVLTTIVLAFYLTVQKEGTSRFLQVLLPDTYEKPVLTIFNNFKTKIRRWFAAQLGLSLIVGVVMSLGLWLLGVRYALVLGIIAAILELVPLIGPVIAGAVALLVAISDSFALGLYVIGLTFIVQQLENHVLIPVLMGKTLNVHPVIVIVSILAGAQIAGFVGILLAVPIAVAAQETFYYLAEKKNHRGALL
jgi:predicted PurR-regulated permease PerM